MRLSSIYCDIIKKEAKKVLGESAQIFLFGSRVNDTKKGGDVDLLIETIIVSDLLTTAYLKNVLEIQLNLPVDLIIVQRGRDLTPFQNIALATSILL